MKHRDSPERQLPRLIEERQDLGVQPVKVKFPSPARVVPQTPSPPPATPPRTWTPTPVTPATDIPVDFALPEDSTITNRELLLSSLSSLNISYKDLGGSGNCLFLSLSDQLANYHSTSSQPAQPRFPKLSARQIRAIVVDEIATNRELYKWDVLAMSTSKDSDSNPEAAYDSYVDSMAKPETYGDAICLAAFARVFDCGIAVWMWDHSKNRVGRVVVEWEDAEDREHDEGEKRRLNVAWMPSERGEAGNHYISVYPPGEIELRGVGH